MSFKEFLVFLMDECHAFLRLLPPSQRRNVPHWNVTLDVSIPKDSYLSDNEQEYYNLMRKLLIQLLNMHIMDYVYMKS